MHKKLIITLLLAMTVLTAGCSTKNDKNVAEIIQDYSGSLQKCDKMRQRKLLVPNSTIVREAHKVGGFHTGTIPVGGNLVLCNRQDITSAGLMLDLKSLTNTDITDPAMKEKLIGHLNSADFFDTVNYPTGKFTLRNVSKNKINYTVIGDLTIKDITKTVSFDVNISKIEAEYNITGDVYLDRTERNVMYGSTKLLDTLKDSAIDDLFKISFDLKTRTMANTSE